MPLAALFPGQAERVLNLAGLFTDNMCFSASASFGAAAVLSVAGVMAIKKSKSPAQITFAAIPLVFAAQQATEGLLWLSLSYPAYASFQQFSTYAFLFFAQVVWPLLVPVAVLKLEPEKNRRIILKLLTATGAIVSAYLFWCLLAYPVSASIEGYHIAYRQDYPQQLSRFGAVLYMLATIFPPFFASLRRMWLIGAMILVSYIITMILYRDYVVSVWCFFSALISFTILMLIVVLNNERNPLKTSPHSQTQRRSS